MYADITIKARCVDPAEAESILLEHQADYVGLEVQTDTYYECETGKLKHRQGTIENVLIQYKREFSEGVQKTDVLLYLKKSQPDHCRSGLRRQTGPGSGEEIPEDLLYR